MGKSVSIAMIDGDADRRRADWDLGAGAGNYLSLLGGQVASALLALAAVWLATEALGSRGYGAIAALIAASQLAGSFAIQWTAAWVFRNGCEEFVATGRIAQTFWNRLAVLAANMALVAAGSVWWLPVVGRFLQIGDQARPLVLAHLLTMSLAIHVQQSLFAAKLPRFQALAQIAERAVLVATLAILLGSGRASFWAVALSFVSSPLVSSVAGLWRLRRLIAPIIPPRRARAFELFRFSYPLAFQLLIGYFTTNYLDAFFILNFLSASHLGVYTLSYHFAGRFMQLPALGGSLLLAFLITSEARGESERSRRFFADVLPTAVLFWSAAAAAAAAAGSALIGVFFDPSFHPARRLLWPLMGAAALAAPVIFGLGPAATARSRTVIPAAGAFVSAVVNVGLNFALIPRWGLAGCAWATTACYGAALLVWAYLAHRLLSVSIGWTILATLPAVVGAIAVQSGRGDGAALLLALGCAALLLALHRGSAAFALRALISLALFTKREERKAASPWGMVHAARRILR
jgi:O-antigen/teichoic acid export membrane protein